MPPPPLVLGPFPVPHLAQRRVRLHLPKHAGEGPPPLVLMFDGQNIFDDAPSFAGGWHLHATAEKIATKRRLEPAIAGIDHGGVQRIDELIPWPGARTRGHLDRLLDWIVAFVIPMLARDYGLTPDLSERIVGGSSLGGLAALYAHHRHPDQFGGAMAMSPSLWVAGQRIFDSIAATPKPWTSRIYLDAGAHEAGGSMLRAAERMEALLRSRGYTNDTLRFRKDPRGQHSERDWRRRAPAALRFLLPAPRKKPC
ncbi:MAG: alpha/beta hydrolase-fold protein [Polyangiaceae bacterium]